MIATFVSILIIILFLAIGAILLRDCIKKLKNGNKKALQYIGIVFGGCCIFLAIWMTINKFVLPNF